MSLFSVMGLTSVIAIALLIVILFVTRLAFYRSFPALLIYYVFILSFLLQLLGYVDLGKNFMHDLGVLNNFIDTPLMLLFLTYFSKTVFFRRRMMILITGFVAFELMMIGIFGFNSQATTIILAPGLLLVLGISIMVFSHQVKIAVVYHRAIGKAVMAASMLVIYVGYAFVYTVFYVIKPVYRDDAHLVYFLITTFTCAIMSVGVYIERKRVNQLHELKITREELKAIYGGQPNNTIANPLEPAMLKFDK